MDCCCRLLPHGGLSAGKPQMTSQINLPSLGAPAGSGELSPADERKIGEQSMEEIRQSPYYLHDPDIHEYLMRLGYRLVAAAPVTPYSFQFFPMKLGGNQRFCASWRFHRGFHGTLSRRRTRASSRALWRMKLPT